MHGVRDAEKDKVKKKSNKELRGILKELCSSS